MAPGLWPENDNKYPHTRIKTKYTIKQPTKTH